MTNAIMPMMLASAAIAVSSSAREGGARSCAAMPTAATRGVLCLTFDDSRFDDWEAVLPIFEKYNARATFFAYHEIDETSVAAMRRLSAAGHSIGLHGLSHLRAPDAMAKLGAEGYLAAEIEPQLSACREAGLPVHSFAYPYSARTPETDALLLRHFHRLRGGGGEAAPFPASEGADRRYLPGVGAGPHYGRGGAEIAAMLPDVAASNSVLVVYSHGIGERAEGVSISRDDLETLLAEAKRLGVACLGFDELDAADAPRLRDPGSLAFVAASDSCEADKARADLVCDGRNDAASINDAIAKMAAEHARGGRIVLFPGTYAIDSWTERPALDASGAHVRRYGVLVPHSQSEIAIEGVGYTHKDTNKSLKMNGRGAVFKLSGRLWGEMEADGHYSLLGAAPTPKGYLWEYSRGFFRLTDVSFSIPGNEKTITVVDGAIASEMSCEGIQISTDAPFGDDSRVNPKCIGIRTCRAGNNGRRYALEFCKLMGLGTAFHIAGEHLVMRQCAAQRCAYGYVFGDVDFLESFSTASGNHPVTMQNCCFEYCWFGITLGGSRHRDPAYVNTFTAIDLNAEEDDGFGEYTAWKSRRLIQNLSNGYWRGDISYFLTAKAKGHIPSARNLWGPDLAEGADFRTVNTAARRRGPTAERPTSMTDLGFGYFDTDLDKMVWRTETGWSE